MTGKRYEQISRDYILPILGKYKLKDIRFEQIEELYRSLLEKEVSIRNVRLAHSVLHKSLNVAVRRGLVGFNAAHGVWVPKMEHREMEILVESEVIQFLICAKDSRHEALFHLAIKTGMRQGELLGLKWSDLDMKMRLYKFNVKHSEFLSMVWFLCHQRQEQDAEPLNLARKPFISCESIEINRKRIKPLLEIDGRRSI